MKQFQLFLAALLVIASGVASAVPVARASLQDGTLLTMPEDRSNVTNSLGESHGATTRLSGVRKIAYYELGRGPGKASTETSTFPDHAEITPIIIPFQHTTVTKVVYDQRASTRTPMSDPETWLLSVLGIGFVALQSGRRSSTVSAIKLQ